MTSLHCTLNHTKSTKRLPGLYFCFPKCKYARFMNGLDDKTAAGQKEK